MFEECCWITEEGVVPTEEMLCIMRGIAVTLGGTEVDLITLGLEKLLVLVEVWLFTDSWEKKTTLKVKRVGSISSPRVRGIIEI